MLSKIKATVTRLVASKRVRSQVGRFVRLAGATLLASGVVGALVHGTATRTSVVAALVGAVEVAFRQVVPGSVDLEAAIAKALARKPAK